MPALPLTPEQKADADKLRSLFIDWQTRQAQAGRRISQERASQALGFGQSALNHYLNGKIPLNPDAAMRFAELLGCSVSDFSKRLAVQMANYVTAASSATPSLSDTALGSVEEPHTSDRAGTKWNDRLRKARDAAGATDTQIAQACGVKPPSVHGWMSGATEGIEARYLLPACKLLNVSPFYIMFGEEMSGKGRVGPPEGANDFLDVAIGRVDESHTPDTIRIDDAVIGSRMNVVAIRRARLRDWLEGRTFPAREKSYFSQLVGGQASFGEKAARRIEQDYRMELGSLDKPYPSHATHINGAAKRDRLIVGIIGRLPELPTEKLQALAMLLDGAE